MAEFEILAHAGTAQVEIAIFHAEVVAAVGVVFNGERRDFAAVQHFQLACDHLDVAGGHIGVLAAAFSHAALHLHHKLAAQMITGLGKVFVDLVAENDLRDAVTVADIHESHTPHFAHSLHPAGQLDAAVHIGKTKLAACLISKHSIYYIA